jgi:alpha-tubulin suppressor-like RCC1 family protein
MLSIRISNFLFIIAIITGMTATDIEVTYDLDRGWNMIAVPCIIEDSTISEIIPLIPPAFIFNNATGHYDEIEYLPEPQYSFWALIERDTSFTIDCECAGEPDDTTSLDSLSTRFHLGCGGFHTIVCKEDSSLWGWGWNDFGQLGDADSLIRLFPVRAVVSDGSEFFEDAFSTSSGLLHSVALRADGTVWSYGNNEMGQIGNGTTDDCHVPTQVMEGSGFLTDVIKISAGSEHNLAIKNDNTVRAWGWNNNGQLGDDTDVNRFTPIRVTGEEGDGYLDNVIDIATGYMHSMALKSDGTVYSWGSNSMGQLGNSTTENSSTPIQVIGEGGYGFLSDVIAIACGDEHSIALKSDGTLYAWGNNRWGQLGNGATGGSGGFDPGIDYDTPVQVTKSDGSDLDNIIAIAAGRRHTLALSADSTIWAWGWNLHGQLGNASVFDQPYPVKVRGEDGSGFISEIIQISCGLEFSAAINKDGNVLTWGENYHGQLGTGVRGGNRSAFDTDIDSNKPTKVLKSDRTPFNIYD